MIDGVLVDQPKAREVYEDKIRQGIDPGMAVVSRANVFSTRVFPIRAKSGRTIRLAFVAPVQPDTGWRLPLMTDNSVGALSINVSTDSVRSLPQVDLPIKQEAQWQHAGGENVLLANAKNQPLSGELRIGPIAPVQPLLVSRHPNGKLFFQLTDQLGASKQVSSLNRVRVYWDRSRSRRDQSTKQEIALLNDYLSAVRPTAIDVVVFNSSGARLVTKEEEKEVAQLLGAVVYRGATSFAVLAGLKLPAVDACLLFSDGVGTIDGRDGFKPDCQLTAITSAADADRGYLRRLTRASGGDMIALHANSNQASSIQTSSIQKLLAQLTNRSPRIVDVRDQNDGRLAFNVVSSGERGWIIVGEAPASGPIVVSIGGPGAGTTTRRYDPESISGHPFEGEAALWAADRIADLAAQDGMLNEVRTLSKRYSIANPAMAFLVLETPQDYAMANVEPPKSYPAKESKIYRAAKAEYDANLAKQRNGRIDAMIASWEEQKEWWSTKFEPSPRKKLVDKAADVRALESVPAPALQMGAPSVRMKDSNAAADLETVVVTGSFIHPSLQESAMPINVIADGSPATRIELQPWNPDRPYLKALDAANKNTLHATLLAQEQLFGELPAFYLDTAEWFNINGRRAEALELLLSALDLPTRNEDTLAVVADRLLRYGQFDRAIWLFEQNLAVLDNLPQPRRALALALVKRAQSPAANQPKRDLLRALHLLNEIITAPWISDYEGIELIALMDANAIVPALKKAGVAKLELDPRLIALLDVDLRVVIQWNTGNTDIDLWVDEPNGERVIYSNPHSSSGGRLSNDMTSGYGPEEYLLHVAPSGKYQIRLNVFAADRINPNGATVVTAHLIRDFGRSTQHEEVIDLELSAGDEGEKFVGEFEVNHESGVITRTTDSR
jgi:hypothetical protein